ncbi:SPOR domain-containing protein [Pseudarcicella hirudinis]|uniref:SPOR domain-containing protein n=1 Tax=Pseudarcicella hirudinis TaxID=1079859 RepID=UPI0035EDF939
MPAPVYRTLQLKDREYIHEDSKEETSIRPIRKASRLLSVITIFLGVSAFISGLYFYDSNPSTGLSSFNPFSVISHFKQHFPETPKVNPAAVEKKDEAVKAEEITASKNAPAENEATKETLVVEKAIITKPETRYYVIAGSFGSEKNADKMRRILKSNGLDQKVEFLFPVKNEKLIKVSAGEFSDETEAKAFSKTVSDKIKQQTWVFKVKN